MDEKSYKYIHDIKITIPKYLLIIEGRKHKDREQRAVYKPRVQHGVQGPEHKVKQGKA